MRRRTTFLSGSASRHRRHCVPDRIGLHSRRGRQQRPRTRHRPDRWPPTRARWATSPLNVLDYFTGGVDNTWMNDVVAAFEKKYPNITVKRTSITWGDVMQELPLKLKSRQPAGHRPAEQRLAVAGHAGPGRTGAQPGLLRDRLRLEASTSPQSILREHEFSADGQQMGTGADVRHAGRPRLADRGLLQPLAAAAASGLACRPRSPTSQADLAKAKPAGITPIALGNLDAERRHPAAVQRRWTRSAARRHLRTSIYSLGQARWTARHPGSRRRSRRSSDWSGKGYFTNQFAGVAARRTPHQLRRRQGAVPLRLLRLAAAQVAGQSKGFGSFLLPRTTAASRSPPPRRRHELLRLRQVQARRRGRGVPQLRRRPSRGPARGDHGTDAAAHARA